MNMKKKYKYTVEQSQRIMDAISVIQGNLTRCVVVVNADQTVVGVFSEGDVLRTVLQGTDLYTPLSTVVKPFFRYMNERDMCQAMQLFKEYGITLIPVLTEDFKLKDIITIFDIMNNVKLEGA
jgi:CBS domain-containing protein